jgi:hypothetical protein
MIAAAMSVVRPIRPTGRRRAIAAKVSAAASPATDCQIGVDVNTIEPLGASLGAPCLASKSGPSSLDSIADRAAPMSYSLIGW